jgi:hypothetical protein
MDWCNSNGLVDGLIPAGEPCPFWDECGRRTDNCPSHQNGNIRMNHGFSCALARLTSLVKNQEKEKAERAQG